eukprot:403350156
MDSDEEERDFARQGGQAIDLDGDFDSEEEVDDDQEEDDDDVPQPQTQQPQTQPRQQPLICKFGCSWKTYNSLLKIRLQQSLSAIQKKKVTDLQGFVNCKTNDKLLTDLLKKHNWDLNMAAEEYFMKGYGEKTGSGKINPQNIQALFNKYKDAQTGNMEGEGIATFYDNLGVDAASDPVTLVISYYMQAQTMGFYTQEEFINGMTKLGCDSIESLRKKIQNLKQELANPAKFKEIYKFIFDFSRDQGFKNVAIDTAIALWQILLSDRCNFLNAFIDFLQSEKKEMIVIQRDNWMMLLELIEQTQGDIQKFVDDGAWPLLIEQFNEFYNRKYKH